MLSVKSVYSPLHLVIFSYKRFRKIINFLPNFTLTPLYTELKMAEVEVCSEVVDYLEYISSALNYAYYFFPLVQLIDS